MSGLLSSLGQSVSALNAQSLGLQTAGRNLANVSNDNYAEEVLVSGDNASGVSATVQQVRDALLDQQVVRETGLTASLTAQSTINTQTQAAFGENIGSTSATASTTTATGSGLGDALSTFFNGFQALAASPTDTGARQTVLQDATTLTQAFNTTDGQLAQIQTDINTQLTGDAGSVNQLLTSIANLNTQINRAEFNSPGSAVDLRDQRQADLEQLAGKMSVETTPSAGSATEVDVYVRDASGNPVDLVTGGSVTNPVNFTGTQVTAGASATPIAMAGGEMQGLITARDGTVQTLRNQLNSLAGQLATSVNAAYNPAGANGNFFQVTAGSEAGTLTVNPALTPTNLVASADGTPGDNTIATAVANLATQSFSTAAGDQIDGTFAQNYAGVVSSLGGTVAATTASLEDQTSIQGVITQQRSSVSGVSLDQEMTNVMQYERAYQASSRVISTIDAMLDTLINTMS